MEFIAEVFEGRPPVVKKLWIKKGLKQPVKDILGHKLAVLRISYWQQGVRTAWILEETGRDHPITAGIVINGEVIESVRVLIFRESRGWEIRYPFFTDQFKDVGSVEHYKLDKNIDGISGATLSVNAMIKLARLALLFHKQLSVNQ